MIEATLICHTRAGDEAFMQSTAETKIIGRFQPGDIVEKPVPRF